MTGVAPGTAGNLLTSNGTSWISVTAPPSGPSLEAVASGSLADGSTVIVNAAGTVSVVQASTAPSSPVLAGAGTFSGTAVANLSSVYHTAEQKVVIAYSLTSDSSRGYAVVGTVVGNTITFGAPVRFTTNAVDNISIVYASVQQKVIIAFRAPGVSTRGYCIVGTVSGTSISYGSDSQFTGSSGTTAISAVYNVAAQRVVVFYTDSNNSSQGTAIVGTVSGTSISFGSSVLIANTSISNLSSTYDIGQAAVVLAYKDDTDTTGKCRVGTVSGTVYTPGGLTSFNPAQTSNIYVEYDSNAQKIVIAYRDDANSNFGTASVGTIAGASASFGAEIVFRSFNTQPSAMAYDAAAQKIIIFYGTDAITGLVSGTSITFGTGTSVLSSGSAFASSKTAYDPITYKTVPSINVGSTGQAALVSSVGSNMTASNFIGFSNNAYSDGQTATIQLVGSIDDAQSGLTAGLGYYVQYNGSLTTFPGTPSIFAGTAVAANKIIVKG